MTPLASIGARTHESTQVGTIVMQEIDTARLGEVFQGEVAPARTSAGYVIAMACAAIVLVALMASYVALILSIAAGLTWHAVYDLSWFSSVMEARGRGTVFKLLLVAFAYAAPLIAGAVTIFFLLKPFFARAVQESWPVPLDPREERLLFALVGRIAALLDAPLPTAIEVDAEVNASARRESFFTNRLVLRVGLPLFLALSARELVVVVAHELGHFRQGTATRLSRLVKGALRWLLEAVYGRDRWDARLDDLVQSDDGWISLVARISRWAVWLSRRILWVLAQVGGLACATLVRQMEYDADRAGAAIAGTATIGRSSQELVRLQEGRERARRLLWESLRAGRLPDDLPALVVAEAKRVRTEAPPATAARAGRNRFSSLFSTHPSDADRIRAVESLAAPYTPEGVLRWDIPAVKLLRHASALSKVVTIATYREILGGHLDALHLEPTSGILRKSAVDEDMDATVARYFGVELSPEDSVPFRTATIEPAEDLERCAAALDALRTRQKDAARIVRDSVKELRQARGNLSTAQRCDALLAAGVRFRERDVGIAWTREAIDAALERSRDEEAFLRGRFEEFLLLSVERLTLALRLGLHPAIREGHPKGATVASMATRLPPALAALALAHDALLDVHRTWCRLESLVASVDLKVENERLRGALVREAKTLHESLRRLKRSLSDDRDPFVSGGAPVSLAETVVGTLPTCYDFDGLAHCVAGSLLQASAMRTRILGRLAAAAELVEKSLLPNRERTSAATAEGRAD